jgi:Flp pilus assembly protein TadG
MFAIKKNSGQGLVEFAFVLPFLLLLVFGVLDFGRAFAQKIALENAAREGAFYMVYNTAAGKANNFALAKSAVQVEGQNSGVVIAVSDIEIYCMQGETLNNACPSGSTVHVRTHHDMTLIVLRIFVNPLRLSGDARMLIP